MTATPQAATAAPGTPSSGPPDASSSALVPPAVTLPKGGGAVRSIGENFTANPANGTGTFRIPLPLGEGRQSLVPDLVLSYDSGGGNGPYGLGWRLDVGAISRTTDRGLPRYDDGADSDTFAAPGGERLVPAYRLVDPPDDDAEPEVLRDAQGRPVLDEAPRDGYVVRRYRPRTEGQFARIERWTSATDPTDVFWRAITADNVTTVYGRQPDDRVTDPADARHVFSWLASERYDDRGHGIVFGYQAEDGRGLQTVADLDGGRPTPNLAQRYLKRVRWGNRISRLDPVDGARWRDAWLFEAVLDHDEGHLTELAPDPGRPVDEQHVRVRAAVTAARPWTSRPDPFSTARAGFEVRTYRRCTRILVFHRIPELGADPCLVRVTDLAYEDLAAPGSAEQELGHPGSTRFGSLLTSVTAYGCTPLDEPAEVVDGVRTRHYRRVALPSLRLGYSRPVIDPAVRTLPPTEGPPLLDGRQQWADLDGDGLSGLLSESAGGWWYRRNAGGGRFAAPRLLPAQPVSTLAGGARLADLDGNGRLDVVDLAAAVPGSYERTDDGWSAHRPFLSTPVLDWADPAVRLADVDGDGRADVLVVGPDVVEWHPSYGREGFGPRQRNPPPRDPEGLPATSGPAELVALADLTGDGLSDLLQVGAGGAGYWPHLGHGRFGTRITMANPPRFDDGGGFDPDRLRLADLDGNGLTDLVYLAADGVRLYLNQSGNRWSDPVRLNHVPFVGRPEEVSVVDLLGSGTACLVWGPTPVTGGPLRYVDLLGGVKPHLLTSVVNSLGAETTIGYAPSTTFALADREAGEPWVTRLPFPVHVVHRVETLDRISGHRAVSTYRYHDGWFDGVERELAGFGRVDQRDTEELDVLAPAPNVDAASYVPPVLTRTWFATGAPEPTSSAVPSPASAGTVLPAGLSLDEQREAVRATRGSVLRQEVLAQDGTERQDRPYLVTEQRFAVHRTQPRGHNPYGVFRLQTIETLTTHTERLLEDPRVQHTVTLATNRYGQLRRTVTVAYGRRAPDPGLPPEAQAEQARLRVLLTEQDYTDAVDDPARWPDDHRTPAPSRSRVEELTGLALPAGQDRFTPDQLATAVASATTLEHHLDPTPGTVQRRLLGEERVRYRRDDLTGPCDVDEQDPQGLLDEAYRRVLTAGLVAQVYRRPGPQGLVDLLPDTAAVLPVAAGAGAGDRGGYVDLDGDGSWWAPSGRMRLAPADRAGAVAERDWARRHFYRPWRFVSPFSTAATAVETTVTYDAYDLQVTAVTDPVGNRTSTEIDYRVLGPRLLTDPNGDRTAVAYDALGLVAAVALLGRDDPAHVEGDRLSGFEADLTTAALRRYLADPATEGAALLGAATNRVVRDLLAYTRTSDQARPDALVSAALARETHVSDLAPGATTRLRQVFSYSDGFGRVVQEKVPAEPDEAGVPRWVGSGWTVYDNKSNPVRRYEPFFSGTHALEVERRAGVSDVLGYDPLLRPVVVVHPDHTYAKVVLEPWRQVSHDAGDTAAPGGTQTGDPRTDPDVATLLAGYFRAEGPGWRTWREQRQAAEGAAAQDVLDQAAAYAGTPTTVYLDSLGRPFLTRQHNGFAADGSPQHVDSRAVLDALGHRTRLVDARGRTTEVVRYDLLGRVLHQSSMDAGQRWLLPDVDGALVRTWDDRGHDSRTKHDALRRPERMFVTGTDPDRSDPQTLPGPVLFQRVVYGETEPDAAARHLRGRVLRQHDGAGWVASSYDFKGNVTAQQRELSPGHTDLIDWANPPAAGERFETRTRYDALGRPVQTVAPHPVGPGAPRSVLQPTYNEAGLLERLDAWTGVAADPDALLDAAVVPPTAGLVGAAYDARGRRVQTVLRNGAVTTSTFDPETFRLTRLYTRRGPSFIDDCGDEPPPPRTAAPAEPPAGVPCGLAQTHYRYDPVGNPVTIRDDAQQRLFFRNQLIDAGAAYVYDPLHRLVRATGREQLGVPGGERLPHSFDDARRTGLGHPGDGSAVARYCESYAYDPVGNLESVTHRVSCPGAVSWVRGFEHAEPSPLPGPGLPVSNRLTSSTVAGRTETCSTGGDGYDAHGNLQRMAHLAALTWDFRNRLRVTRRQAVDADDADGLARQGERTFSVYDSAGQRVRKVTETATGQLKEERIYLGATELYRRHGGPLAGLQRETLRVVTAEGPLALVERRSGVDDGTPAEVTRYQVGDHLGSAALELDEQARIISYEEYSPYGSTTYQAVRRDIGVAAKRYRFGGQERDEESGLCHHGARCYAPWLGRWTSVDPEGPQEAESPYAYVRGAPTRFVDPGGRQEQKPPPQQGSIGVAVAGATFELLFTMTTGQTPEHFGKGWWAKAKSISADPVLTIYGPGGMLNQAADKAVNWWFGNPDPGTTPEEHARQLDAIVQIAMTLFPGLKFKAGPGLRTATAVTPEGVTFSVAPSTGGATVSVVPAQTGAVAAAGLTAAGAVGGKKPGQSQDPGAWEEDLTAGTNMNPEQKAYQKQITGKPASQTYHVNGTAFDGFEKGAKGAKDTLLEAKHLGDEGRFAKAYETMMNDPKKLTDIKYLFDKAEDIVEQARRQVRATKGLDVRIEWRVSGQRAEEALNLLFSRDPELAGRIQVTFVKFQPPVR